MKESSLESNTIKKGLLLLTALMILACQGCTRLSCTDARATTQEAEREQESVANEVTQGGTTFPSDKEALDKGRLAAIHVQRAREKESEACSLED